MKILKVVLIIIIVLVAIFFIGGLFLPKTYSVSRSEVIKAPQATAFRNVANFNNFLKWNPWTKMEPSAKVKISGAPEQVGHLWKWAGKDTGEGQMEISKVEPNSRVDFILTFTKPFQSVARNYFQFEPVADGTKVTWTMNGKSSSTMERWMYLNMDNMLGKDFESGLQNLKQLSENQQ